MQATAIDSPLRITVRIRDRKEFLSFAPLLIAILVMFGGCSSESDNHASPEKALPIEEQPAATRTSGPTKAVKAEAPPKPVISNEDSNQEANIPSPTPEILAANLKKEAVSTAIRVAEKYPKDPLTHVLLGSAYYNTGRSDEASKHLTRGLELRPNLLAAHQMLAKITYEKGEPEETVRICQEAMKQGETSTELLIQLGRAQLDLGDTDAAIQTLESASKRSNPPVESYYLLGQAHMQFRQYDRAKSNFLQVIQLMPEHTQAYFGLFTSSQRLGQAEDATKYREHFVKLEAQDRNSHTDRSSEENTLSGMDMVQETVARTLFGAAQIHQSKGAFTEAEGLFHRAASLHPDNFTFRSALEAFYVKSKNVSGGISAFETLILEEPQDVLNHYFLGRLKTREKDYTGAEACFVKVQSLMPGWASGYEALAELYLGSKRNYDSAQKLATRAVELDPNAYRYYLLALISLRTNDRPSAFEAARRATAMSPGQKKYAQLFQQLQAARNKTPASQ